MRDQDTLKKEELLLLKDLEDRFKLNRDWLVRYYRLVSGTYKNRCAKSDGTVLELRVDVDGRRAQQRLSGDVFLERGFNLGTLRSPALSKLYTFTLYQHSFVVDDVAETVDGNEIVLTGPIQYYHDASIIDEKIEVRIQRVSFFKAPADAMIKIFKNGTLQQTFCNPKVSDYFRTVTLEIDRLLGTSFPAKADTGLSPSPTDLPDEDLSTEHIFKRSGIDLTVTEDDVVGDSDSADAGSNWDEGELHDLMEDNFDKYSNKLQWNVYGVVVPKFGDPNYNSGYYGTMFDWGGWQTGDTYLRQGAAIALDAIKGRASGTLYDNSDKQDRLILQTFVHEIGHAFNLPHSWSRTNSPDSASNSFMNYPWGYTGGTGGESQFWSNFRWEFDDEELIWMRHADRKDVIFGGNDWIGNNLSLFTEPQAAEQNPLLRLSIASRPVFSLAEPVSVQIELTNISDTPLPVVDRLEPEDGLVTFYVKKPNGDQVRYIPPVKRLKAPGDEVTLEPGESIYESVGLSYGAKGLHFREPGEYTLRAFYGGEHAGFVQSTSLRIRVSASHDRETEELAHLMFDRKVAKFMYFKGTERYPETTSKLEEATRVYARTNPETVRWIHGALGFHFARDFKCLTTRDEKRSIAVRKADLKKGVHHLSESLEPLHRTQAPALDPVSYARTAVALADALVRDDRAGEADERLRQTLETMQAQKAPGAVLSDLELRIEDAKGRGRVKGRGDRKRERSSDVAP